MFASLVFWALGGSTVKNKYRNLGDAYDSGGGGIYGKLRTKVPN